MKCITKEDFDSFKGVCVLCEARDGQLTDAAIELVSEGRRLADKTASELCAILPGFGVGGLAETLGGYGADRVLLCEHELLRDYTAETYAKVVCDIVQAERPDTLLLSATTIGRDLAPRCAARLCTGLNADCTVLHIGSGDYREYLEKNSVLSAEDIDKACAYTGLKMTMPAFGGHLMATITCPQYRPQMATVRPGMMKRGEYDAARAKSCRVERPALELGESDVSVRVLECAKSVKSSVDLSGAQVIVSVGMGIRKNSERGLRLANELAEALGGVVGATRDAVTEGWLSEEHMIGQTGKIVRPKLYIALGISGAIQHRGGMKDSEFIVAVNTDEKAPIFEIADCALVGDLFEIVPKLIEAARHRGSAEK